MTAQNADRKLNSEFTRFVMVAGLQAIANYGSYLVVLQFAPWWIAFLVAISVGITLQTVMQIRTTFAEKVTVRRSVPYVAYQVAYTIVFAALLKSVIDSGISPELAPLIVLAVVTPISFLLSRWIIRR